MKKEYDFSKGVRGKFYRSDAKLRLPVYLEPDAAAFLRKIAEEKIWPQYKQQYGELWDRIVATK